MASSFARHLATSCLGLSPAFGESLQEVRRSEPSGCCFRARSIVSGYCCFIEAGSARTRSSTTLATTSGLRCAALERLFA